MKHNKSIFIIIVFVISITGCSKSAGIPSDKQSYIGIWIGKDMLLNISDAGRVEYERDDQKGKRSVNGPIQEFKGNDFIVGALGFTTTFHVQNPPVEKDGVWKMTVDGVELVKQPPMTSGVVPTNGTLVYLTNKSMDVFAQSIKEKDFKYLYNDISRLWQSQTSAADLQKIFKVFIDKSIDLSSVTKKKPVFAKKPVIDENGVLIIEGYYPQKPLVTVRVKYIFEDPQWKLMGFACYVK